MKRQYTEQEKSYDISDKVLVSKIYDGNSKKETQLKNGQRKWIDIFPKKTYRRPKDSWKHAQITNHLGKASQNHHKIYYTYQKRQKQRPKISFQWDYVEKGNFVHCWLEYDLVQPL